MAEASAAGTARRLLRNSAALSIGQLIVRAISVLSVFVIAHALGPSKIGEIALAQTLAGFFAGLADAGLTLWTSRAIVLAPKRLSQLVVDTTFVQLWLSAAFAAVVATLALALPLPSGSARLLLLFTPYLLTQALNVEYALQALERMVAVASIRIVVQLVTTAGTIALVLATHDPVWVPVMLWAGQLVGDVILIAVLRSRHGLRPRRPRVSHTRRLLRAGLPLLVSVVLINYWGAISTLTLAIVGNSHELGIFSAPFSLMFAAWLLAEVAAGGAYPELVRRWRDDRRGFATLLRALVRVSGRLTLGVAALIGGAAGPLVTLLYGSRFAGSGTVLAILAPIMPLGWFASLMGFALIAGGHQREFAFGLAAGAAVATVGYPVCTVLFGARGAAAASTGTVIVLTAALGFFVRRRLGVRTAGALLSEWRYGVVPLIVVVLVRLLAAHGALVPELAAWLPALALVEALQGLPTVRQLQALRRVRAPGIWLTPPNRPAAGSGR